MGLEIVPTPGNVVGLGNLSLGADQRCPGAIGCRGTLPPAVVPFDFQVFLCHPPDPTQLNCNGLAPDKLLSHSMLAPAEAQRWLVSVTRTDPVDDITFTWRNSSLPASFGLWIVDSQGRFGMHSPPRGPSDPPLFYKVFDGFNANTREFLICSQVEGTTPENPCPSILPLP